MQTIILVAGEGTRMRPLTASRPKPMLPVAGSPLVEHTIDAIASAGATRIILVVGYQQDVIRDYFGAEYAGVEIEYAVQSSQKGTADAVRAAQQHLDDAPFVVLNGDALYDDETLERLYHCEPAVGVHRVDNPRSYGVIETDESNEIVEGIVEKPSNPPTDLVNTGAYVFPSIAQEWLNVDESERGELELTNVLARTCDEHDVQAVPFEQWLDVGRPWELLAANEWKLQEETGEVEGDVETETHLGGDVVVEDGATIRSGVTIEGPALIQSGATVGPNAYLRGPTLVGENASIGHAAEVKNSVIMTGARVNHLSYVGDSILGRNVNLGAGTNVANLRHDDRPIHLTVKGERVSTGRRKFGIVAGEGVKTGINTSLNAGVKLSAGSTTRPGETVMEDQ